jgi:threonine/homoserine/homoserine lactone efflux protein
VQIRTLAAILAWIVVALLLLNGMIRSVWITVASIVLTGVAVLLYFIPRLRKNKKTQEQKPESEKTTKKN